MASLKPVCKYGSKCYRKNPDHLRRYSHPSTPENDDSSVAEPAVSGTRTRKRGADEAGAGGCISESKRAKLTEETSSDSQPLPYVSEAEPSAVGGSTSSLNTVTVDSETKHSHTASDEGTVGESVIDATELERDGACKDAREKVRRKFLVDMPEDFYQFWEFCKSLDPSHPKLALVSSIGMELVGPYDVLAGRLDGVMWERCVLHSRFFYDPPEIVTVAKRTSDQYHLGFFRDDPRRDNNVLVVSNDPSTGCELKLEAQNIFAAMKFEVETGLKSRSHDSEKLKLLRRLDSQLEMKMTELQLTSIDAKTLVRQRGKEIVTKCLNKIGMVVPYDRETDIGYRPLPKTNRELVRLLDRISQCSDVTKRDQLFEPLQEIITYVQFANDECDYGMGLELGLDLFCHSDSFHRVVSHILPLAYSLLQRPEYGKIVEQHILHRQHTPHDFSTP